MPAQPGVQVTLATPPPIVNVEAKAGAANAMSAAAATPIVLIIDIELPKKTHAAPKCAATTQETAISGPRREWLTVTKKNHPNRRRI